jgi:hypothetical protein
MAGESDQLSAADAPSPLKKLHEGRSGVTGELPVAASHPARMQSQ